MQRWEYMTFDLVKRKNEIEELNRLGREGWEAVAIEGEIHIRVIWVWSRRRSRIMRWRGL